MKPSTIKKLAYQPMIKFIGGPHIFESTASSVSLQHACSPNGLLPNTSECLSIPKMMENWKPFVVKPYINTTKPSQASASLFSPRPLHDNEVSSISQLPEHYKFKPIDPIEMEIIMGGGAPL